MEAVRELNWISFIAVDLAVDVGGERIVQVDNKQVLSFKYSTCPRSRLKGMISNRWEWVQEMRSEGVDMIYVKSSENKADILTKCLARKEFMRQKEQIIQSGI